MNVLAEVLQYSVPLLLVLASVIWVIYNFIKLEKVRAIEKRKIKNSSALFKIRLQAYERLVLFLERISPQQLVIRHRNQNLSAFDFHSILVENIREEYEHNLVQQIYVSNEAWSKLEQARLWILKLVNDAAGNLDEAANGNDLSVLIVEKEMLADKNYIQLAILSLKNEVQQFF